jgi:hypothetical protein
LADIVFIPIKTTPLHSHSKEPHPIFDFSPLTQPSATIPFTPSSPHTHKEQSTGIKKEKKKGERKTREYRYSISKFNKCA